MKILFIHNNFPGQYRRLYDFLSKDASFDVRCATLESNTQSVTISKVTYSPQRSLINGPSTATASFDRAVIFAESVESALLKLKSAGWFPDVICFHSGWGVGMYLRDVFPDARIIAYIEWFYNVLGSDIEFLMGERIPDAARKRSSGRNASILLDMAMMDWGVSPTEWQRSQIPRAFRGFVDVIHDGIDTKFMRPDPSAVFSWEGLNFKLGDPVITYVARGLEPYRGFPNFMSAVRILQRRHPQLHVLIVGADRVAYGQRRADGQSYKTAALSEAQIDLSRVHFLGIISLSQLRQLFCVSACHVYLTVPFVLSWSMLEAMACECLVVGSKTSPVMEVIQDGANGVLADLNCPMSIADAVTSCVSSVADYGDVRKNARQTILLSYSSTSLLHCHRQLILDVQSGRKSCR